MAGAVRRVGAAAARADGTAVAYLMAVVNSTLAVIAAFGVAVTPGQSAAVVGFANAVLVASLHLARRNGHNGVAASEPTTREVRGGRSQ